MKFLSQINVNTEYTLPIVDGTNGQVLTTDGSGAVYWGSVSIGALNLDGLQDVVITTPTSGQILRYGIPVGSEDPNPVWYNWSPNYLTPSSSIDNLGDVTITSVTAGQLLQWNGSAWVNATLSTVEYVSKVQHTVKAGVAISKGQAVYITGADGTNMIAGLASNAAEATSSKVIGLAASNAAINDQIFVVTEGLLAGLNTSTATAGDPVWLGTNGNLIFGLLNKPASPAHLVYIGVVTRVQQNNGEIFVKVQNGIEIDEIHDVQISSPATGQLLRRDSDGYWKNWTPNFLVPSNVSGTTNYISKFTGANTVGNSQIFDNGTNVGIGTTSPSQKFVVSNGSAEVFKVYDSGEIIAGTNYIYAAASGTSFYSQGAASFRNSIYNDTAAYLQISGGTSGYTYFSGNVGIGTASPGYKLDVNGVAGASGFTSRNFSSTVQGFSIESGDSAVTTYRFDSDRFRFFSGNFGEIVTILESGNVGIGTTAPSTRFQVNKGSSGNVASFTTETNTAGAYAGITLNSTTQGADDWYGSEIRNINVNGNPNFLNPRLAFFVQNTNTYLPADRGEKMTINGDGNVGIGTTSPNAKLDVNGAANATSFSSTALFIANADTSGSLQPDQGSPANKIYSFRWQGGEQGYIDTDAKITFAGFKTPTGTASQFLKANGTVDSNVYITSAALSGYATQAWVNSNFYTQGQIDDFFGGAEPISGYNKSNWDTAYNDKINSASFNTADGVLTLTQQDGGTVTVDLDGRYVTSATDSQSLIWDVGSKSLSITNGNTVTLDGLATEEFVTSQGYITGYTETDTLATVTARGATTNGNIVINGEATIQNSGYLRLIAGSSEMSGFTVFNSAQNGYLSNRITTSAHSRGWGWEFTTNEANNNAGNVYFRVGYNGAVSYLNSGNFGIGTTAPKQKLDVDGNISLGSWTKPGSTYVGLRRADDGSFGAGGDSGLVIESYNHASPYTGDYSQRVHLRTHLYNGGSHNVLTAYGFNVGIGTTTPTYKLHVAGNAYINETLYVNQQVTVEDNLLVTTGIATVSKDLGTNDYANTGQHNMHLRLRKASLDGGCAPRALELGVLDNGTGIIQANHCGVGYNTLSLNPVAGSVLINGNTAWHAGNDGSGSGLDADLIDGIDSSRIVYGDGARASISSSSINDPNQKSGFYFYNNPTGQPFGEWWNWMTVAGNSWQSSNNYSFQIAHAFHSDDAYIRRMTSGEAYGWRRIWTDADFAISNYLPLSGGTLSGAIVVNLGNVSSDTVAFKVGGPSNYDSLTIGMEDTPDYDAFIASFGNDIRFYSGKAVTTENHSFYWFTSKAGTSQHSSVAMVLDHNQALSVTGAIYASGGNSTNWNAAYGWGNHADAPYWNVSLTDAVQVEAQEVIFAGNVTIQGTLTESSSIRFKENITLLDPALDKVNQLEAVSYNKIGEDTREIGLIAEEVAELFPEVVTYNDEGQPQGIQYQRLSVILLKAMQEQNAVIAALTERVNKLENK